MKTIYINVQVITTKRKHDKQYSDEYNQKDARDLKTEESLLYRN